MTNLREEKKESSLSAHSLPRVMISFTQKWACKRERKATESFSIQQRMLRDASITSDLIFFMLFHDGWISLVLSLVWISFSFGEGDQDLSRTLFTLQKKHLITHRLMMWWKKGGGREPLLSLLVCFGIPSLTHTLMLRESTFPNVLKLCPSLGPYLSSMCNNTLNCSSSFNAQTPKKGEWWWSFIFSSYVTYFILYNTSHKLQTDKTSSTRSLSRPASPLPSPADCSVFSIWDFVYLPIRIRLALVFLFSPFASFDEHLARQTCLIRESQFM